MIAGSLLLILVAVVLLGAGLARGENLLLIGSIAASLLAAIALVAGARQANAGLVEQSDEFGGQPASGLPDDDAEMRDLPVEPGPSDGDARQGEAAGIPAQLSASVLPDDLDDEDPPDEPPARQVMAADAARLAQLSIEVLVVDGRPRYHLAGCQHLLGRESEPLPVSEAVDLGFTPCSLCEPDTALLAEARRA